MARSTVRPSALEISEKEEVFLRSQQNRTVLLDVVVLVRL
jgi:hypothetical protein